MSTGSYLFSNSCIDISSCGGLKTIVQPIHPKVKAVNKINKYTGIIRPHIGGGRISLKRIDSFVEPNK
jgi:hypothetical protein